MVRAFKACWSDSLLVIRDVEDVHTLHLSLYHPSIFHPGSSGVTEITAAVK